jgi:hypothetical protein
MRISSLFGVLAGIVILASVLPAGQIALTESNVIGASGSYWGPWNDGQFGAQNILSQQTGQIHENWGDASYWINPDNGPGPYAAYIVIDLGAEYQMTSFTLFNTHNGYANDRGTGDFQIQAGNNPGGLTPNDPSLAIILTGTLAVETDNNYYLTPQSFTVTGTGGYRYLLFEPLTESCSGRCYSGNVYGLNEIRVFGDAVPEPATWLMAVPLLALLWKRHAG